MHPSDDRNEGQIEKTLKRGLFEPHHSCFGPESVVPHASARCCVTDIHCVPVNLSYPPLPAAPGDATGSPVGQLPPTGK